MEMRGGVMFAWVRNLISIDFCRVSEIEDGDRFENYEIFGSWRRIAHRVILLKKNYLKKWMPMNEKNIIIFETFGDIEDKVLIFGLFPLEIEMISCWVPMKIFFEKTK